jgi:UDP-3-O-[3-hydroxymyristoyl] N-acetylglucosamine deacetylase/3-hydroxyacyl-[acyl-carrier-protein] dehydratase
VFGSVVAASLPVIAGAATTVLGLGGILALSTVPDPENYLTYFLKMDDVKFKQKVVPGDTMVFHLELMEPIRRGIVKMIGKAYVGDKCTTEAVLTALITKDK